MEKVKKLWLGVCVCSVCLEQIHSLPQAVNLMLACECGEEELQLNGGIPALPAGVPPSSVFDDASR